MAQKGHSNDGMNTQDDVRHSTRTRIPSHYIIEQQLEEQAFQDALRTTDTVKHQHQRSRHRRQRQDTNALATDGVNHDQGQEQQTEEAGNHDDHATKTYAFTTGTGNEPAADGEGRPMWKRPRRSAHVDSKDDPRQHSKATRGNKLATAVTGVRHSSRTPKPSAKRQALLDDKIALEELRLEKEREKARTSMREHRKRRRERTRPDGWCAADDEASEREGEDEDEENEEESDGQEGDEGESGHRRARTRRRGRGRHAAGGQQRHPTINHSRSSENAIPPPQP